MNETTGGVKGRTRKIYSRPAVKKVHLKPEEAVLGGCKTASTKGPAHGKCNIPTPCAAIVS
jgi:hypothetical protein